MFCLRGATGAQEHISVGRCAKPACTDGSRMGSGDVHPLHCLMAGAASGQKCRKLRMNE